MGEDIFLRDVGLAGDRQKPPIARARRGHRRLGMPDLILVTVAVLDRTDRATAACRAFGEAAMVVTPLARRVIQRVSLRYQYRREGAAAVANYKTIATI